LLVASGKKCPLVYHFGMTNPKYLDEIRRVVEKFDPARSNRYFLFGSAARKATFRDIDLGVMGNSQSRKKLSDLRDYFYDSRIPYKVDVVDFDEADSDFREHVIHDESLIWIR